MKPIVVDIVAALSLVAIVTSGIGLLASFIELIGLMTHETIISITIYFALRTPIIAASLAGGVIVYHEYQLHNIVAHSMSKFKDKLQSLKSQKPNPPTKKVM
jgi:hypothetical protein